MSEKKYKHYSENDYKHYKPIPIPAPSIGPRGNNYSNTKCDVQTNLSFCVPLSFDQELAENNIGSLVPLSTIAENLDGIRGILKLKFNSSLSRVAYAVYVFKATNPNNKITAAHLHLGTANLNGPVIVELFNGPARNVDGILINGLIDNSNIIIADQLINSVASLYQAIRDGILYANVHSQSFPDGIIRGQIYSGNNSTQ